MSRPAFFKTDDGYVLRWDSKRRIWTDGDLEFLSDERGYPLDASGKWLEGIPVTEREAQR